jgi:hypothetical protein
MMRQDGQEASGPRTGLRTGPDLGGTGARERR